MCRKTSGAKLLSAAAAAASAIDSGLPSNMRPQLRRPSPPLRDPASTLLLTSKTTAACLPVLPLAPPAASPRLPSGCLVPLPLARLQRHAPSPSPLRRDYNIALRLELKRRDIKDDPARVAELAAYFTHCNLQARRHRPASRSRASACARILPPAGLWSLLACHVNPSLPLCTPGLPPSTDPPHHHHHPHPLPPPLRCSACTWRYRCALPCPSSSSSRTTTLARPSADACWSCSRTRRWVGAGPGWLQATWCGAACGPKARRKPC